jgi:hypothetical protein
MRLTIAAAVLFCAAVCGCGILPPNDTATMPLNQWGGPMMNQNDAIGLSSWALKDPANTRGDPERAARAIAAEDWLAGQDMLTPDFGDYQPVAEVSWGEFRRQVRAAIGVAPGTPSQVVVDHLLAAADALHAGNTAAAQAQLQPPAFTLGPQGTLAALSNLPRFSGRDWAYAELDRNENRSTRPCMGMLSC